MDSARSLFEQATDAARAADAERSRTREAFDKAMDRKREADTQLIDYMRLLQNIRRGRREEAASE